MVNRVVKYGLVTAVCALLVLLTTTPVNAVSWSDKGSDGKVCRVLVAPHFHVAVSGDRKTERTARASAVKRWKRFTAWEYGPGWDKVSLAKHKSFVCTRILGGWRCLFTAQPCKS